MSNLDLITADLLDSQYSVKRLAEICYFIKDTSNKYIDYCSDLSWKFSFSNPTDFMFLDTLNQEDKAFFIDLILNSESAKKYIYEDLCDCDYDLQEVA